MQAGKTSQQMHMVRGCGYMLRCRVDGVREAALRARAHGAADGSVASELSGLR